MKNMILISLILGLSYTASAAKPAAPEVLMSCSVDDKDISIESVTILDGKDPQHLVSQIIYKNGKKETAVGSFLKALGGSYESFDLSQARDNEIQVSSSGPNLFLTFERDYVAMGAMDIACEAASDSLEQQIRDWKSGKSLREVLGPAGFSMRGFFDNQMADFSCGSGKWARQAEKESLQEYLKALNGQREGMMRDCYTTSPEDGVSDQDHADYIAAVTKYAASLK